MFENLLGEFIREKRKELGLSLRDIAAKAEISFSQWSKLERGMVKDPTDETLSKVSYALNVDKDRIYTLAGRIPPDFEVMTQQLQRSAPESFYGHLSQILDGSARISEESNVYLYRTPLMEQFAEVAASAEDSRDLSADDIAFIAKELESAYKLSVKRLRAKKSED